MSLTLGFSSNWSKPHFVKGVLKAGKKVLKIELSMDKSKIGVIINNITFVQIIIVILFLAELSFILRSIVFSLVFIFFFCRVFDVDTWRGSDGIILGLITALLNFELRSHHQFILAWSLLIYLVFLSLCLFDHFKSQHWVLMSVSIVCLKKTLTWDVQFLFRFTGF